LAVVEAAYGRDYFLTEPLFKVFTFRPCIEAVFFDAPKALEALLGVDIDERTIEEGKARPKQVLRKLANSHGSDWLESLVQSVDERIQTLLLEGEQVTRLRELATSLITSFAK